MAAQRRDAEWFVEALDTCDFHDPVHCRRIHYTVLSRGLWLPRRRPRGDSTGEPRPYQNILFEVLPDSPVADAEDGGDGPIG